MNDLFPKRQNGLRDLGVDDRMTLNCILKKKDISVSTGLNWLRIGNTVMKLRFP